MPNVVAAALRRNLTIAREAQEAVMGPRVEGRRLLTEGRLRIVAASERHVVAHALDNGHQHLLTVDSRHWTCSCPETGDCSHLAALHHVVLQPLHNEGPGPDGQQVV
jgi:hypothetical protein